MRQGPAVVVIALIAGLGCGDPPLDLPQVRQRVDRLERSLETAHRASWSHQWDSYVHGTVLERAAPPGSLLAYFELDSLARWRGRAGDRDLQRRIELLYRHCLRAQVESDPAIAALAAPVVASRLGRVQRLGGFRVTDSVLAYMIRFDPRRQRREEAWRLLRGGDPDAKAAIEELIRRRNGIARRLGFADYYQLYLAQEDLQLAVVDRLLDELERRSREPARLAAEQAQQALGVDRLRPWDGEYVLHGALDYLEPLLTSDLLSQRVMTACADLGLATLLEGVRVAPPRFGSGARTYVALPVDPPHDVRVVVTEGAGFYAYRGAFHEMGHAIYYRGAEQPRPIDRLPPSGALSEGFAKLFERLPYQPQWWQRYLEAPPQVVALVRPYAAADELRRVRFFLANHRFERAAYADPDQDLDELYRMILSDLTFEDWPGGESSWTAISHFVTQPFANLEYLHARLIQAQVYRTVRESLGTVVGNPEVGPFLLEHLVRPGSTRRWSELVRDTTGSELTADAYVEDELGLE